MRKIAYYCKRLSFVLAFVCGISAFWVPDTVMYLKIACSSLIAMVFFYVVEETATPFTK